MAEWTNVIGDRPADLYEQIRQVVLTKTLPEIFLNASDEEKAPGLV